MEFGKNWLQPVNDRLKKKYAHLNIEELNYYDTVCRQARDTVCKFVYKRLSELCDNRDTIKENDLNDDFNLFVTEQFSWISSKNANALFSQSLYYAWKDGLDTCIVR